MYHKSFALPKPASWIGQGPRQVHREGKEEEDRDERGNEWERRKGQKEREEVGETKTQSRLKDIPAVYVH